MDTALTLSGPEAGLLLAALVSVADDIPSPAEEAILKTYFSVDTAVSIEKKFKDTGISYPRDLPKLAKNILNQLLRESPAFQKRCLAVALAMAMADGDFSQSEMKLLNKFCNSLKTSLHEIDIYRKKKLQPLDEEGNYQKVEDLNSKDLPLDVNLAPKEAALALVTWTAFSDDNPSEPETALLREYFTSIEAERLIEQIDNAGGTFPQDLPRLQESILTTMKTMDRKDQLKYLTLAYKTAQIDGSYAKEEKDIIDKFCLELMIGEGELKQCSPLISSLFWRK